MQKQDANKNKIGDTVISDADTNVIEERSKTLKMTCVTLIEEHNLKKMNASQMRSYVQKLMTNQAVTDLALGDIVGGEE